MATVGSVFTVKLIAMEARAASLAKGQRQTLFASELDDLIKASENAGSGLVKEGLGKISGKTYQVTQSNIDSIMSNRLIW